MKQKLSIMKKIIICLSFAFSVFLMQSCNERTETKMRGNTPESDVPAVVKTSFSSKYPGASDVEWEKKTENNTTVYEVEFKQNSKETEATFDMNGTFISEKND